MGGPHVGTTEDLIDATDFLSTLRLAAKFGLGTLVLTAAVAGGSGLVRSWLGDAADGFRKQVTARGKLREFRVAVEVYRQEFDAYPWGRSDDPGGCPMADVIRALAPQDTRLTKGTSPGPPGRPNLLDFDPAVLGESPEGGGVTVLDPWGREYRLGTDPATAVWRMWSVGPDGIDQGGDGDDLTP